MANVIEVETPAIDEARWNAWVEKNRVSTKAATQTMKMVFAAAVLLVAGASLYFR